MARKNTIKLLLINTSDSDGEDLVRLFRGAGRVARVHRVADAAELAAVSKQSWDLLIAEDGHPELTVEQCLEHLRQHQPALPVIVVRAGADLAALFGAGARDVVAPGDEQRLVFASLRELEWHQLHRHIGELERQLREVEQRNALLLGESQQAIAYVADGMVIGANPLFAERFGYGDADELDCLPVIDLIAAPYHDAFKAVLKAGDNARLGFTGIAADGGEFDAFLQVNPATYDGDPCTQLTVAEAAASDALSVGENDPLTGLPSRHALLAQLELAPAGGMLLLVALDNFGGLRNQLGYGGAHQAVAGIAELVRDTQELPEGSWLARAEDDCLALLVPGLDAETAQQLGEAICRSVEAHILDVGEQSLHCSVSIGIIPTASEGPAQTLDHAGAAVERIRATSKRDGIGNAALVHTPERAKRTLHLDGDMDQTLEEALGDNRFLLLFQPVISLRGARGDHYESLLRMQGDTDALELPDNFLQALGVTPGNARLDRWILLEATKQLAENRQQGHDTRLLINLTANALHDEGLPQWLGVALKAADLPPQSLVLQFRESDIINYIKPAQQFADTVHQLGCQFAICGFGKALDPMKTLKNVSSDMVQVAGDFTRDLQTSGDASPLKALVTGIAAADVKVVVPFVENASMLATLWQVGADFIQGHYLQAPAREMNYEFTDIA